MNFSPDYAQMHGWEVYSAELGVEFRQSMEEGKDIGHLKALFDAVAALPASEERERLADVLFDMVCGAPQRQDYRWNEPSDLAGIRALRDGYTFEMRTPDDIADRIRGAWYGRIAGCLLGKTVEGIRTPELHDVLRTSGNFPMTRYIRRTDITDELAARCTYPLRDRCFADCVDAMPADDDTNYMVLYQRIVDRYGRDFTPLDVSRAWMDLQPKNAYCTAERVAFRNFVSGRVPPVSAMFKNPYREWIGAQIRGDYFGYINPGDPETAAGMAWRDASVSHTKNGIYGEMFASAMIACAAAADDLETVIRGGMAQIPTTSRLYAALEKILSDWRGGVSEDDCFADIARRWNEFDGHDWCHTISNAEIVAASLLYGAGDYGRSICRAVQTGFDTDCNGATVGSVLGMRGGMRAIPEQWLEPLHGQLDTAIFGVGRIRIDDAAAKTLKHLPK